MIAAGLMSGTSLDGIDVAVLDLRPRGNGYRFELLAGGTLPFAPDLRERLLAALPSNRPAPPEIAALDVALGHAFGQAVREVAGGRALDYVASHGLTLYHDGDAHLTAQIGDPFVMRELLGTTVIADFRRADCAAGGQGAPLVPYVDALLLASDDEDTVALNIGGIANLTLIPCGASPDTVRAWDCGPGNMTIDAFARERTRGEVSCDRDGAWARAGRVDDALLREMLADPYFTREPPKSTGRERFGAAFMDRHRSRLDGLSMEDGCATLTALTVEGIARDIRAHADARARVVISGGGARNPTLVARLRERVAPRRVLISDELGIDADLKEAIAFAVLGYETLRGRAASLPSATGARRATVLGVIVPYDLAALQLKIARDKTPGT